MSVLIQSEFNLEKMPKSFLDDHIICRRLVDVLEKDWDARGYFFAAGYCGGKNPWWEVYCCSTKTWATLFSFRAPTLGGALLKMDAAARKERAAR